MQISSVNFVIENVKSAGLTVCSWPLTQEPWIPENS